MNKFSRRNLDLEKMKEYQVQQVYDEGEFTHIYQVIDVKSNRVELSVGPKEGNLLDAIKSKLKKEYIVYEGYLQEEIGLIRSNLGLASKWTMIIGRKDIAKAEVKGIQYFTIKVNDGKTKFAGKTTDITKFELKKGREISACVKIHRTDKDGALDMSVQLECKMSPEAVLCLAMALDHKYLHDNL